MNDHDRIITEAAGLLDEEADVYETPESPRHTELHDAAAALRDLLPKPRFYAERREVWERIDYPTPRRIHYVMHGNLATASQLAQDIAASYNQRLGEVE